MACQALQQHSVSVSAGTGLEVCTGIPSGHNGWAPLLARPHFMLAALKSLQPAVILSSLPAEDQARRQGGPHAAVLGYCTGAGPPAVLSQPLAAIHQKGTSIYRPVAELKPAEEALLSRQLRVSSLRKSHR